MKHKSFPSLQKVAVVLEKMGARLAPAPPAPETTIEADDVKSKSLVASQGDENLAMSIESWLDQVAKKETGQAEACFSLSLVANV